MANKSMNSISLKALVDKRSNKVVFIETDDDFVDVLFNFLTIPMGTIIRLAREHSVPVAMDCMNNLYASVENIDASLFQSESCKDMFLCPRSGAESHCKNLKLKISNGEPTRYFLCSEVLHTHKEHLCSDKIFSHYKDVLCECGEPMDNEISLSVGKLKKSSFADGGVFCKGLTRFIITDDLQVMPPLSSAISSLFTKLGVMDASTTEEQAFNVGVDEVLNLLVCSLVSKMPLSETLLKHKSEPNLSSEYPNQGPQAVGGRMDEEGNISVKLMVSKSQKMVCYAEAGQDFVSLLFSFLTVPLGFIVKQMKNSSSSLKGCIEQLYKSVQDLEDQYLKSNYHKEILLTPKLYPGFCYENHLLGIEDDQEASYYYANYWTGDSFSEVVTTDKVYIPSCSSHMPSVTTIPLKPKYCKTQYDGIRAQGFLNGPTMFTITDNLIIRPISPLFGLSVLKEMKVPFADIEEQIVQVGKKELFSGLTTYISTGHSPKQSMAAIISLKALVDKESNKVIFIEPDNDFVDVLFSFLAIPMGTIVKLTSKQSVPLQLGCMKNLYESVANIDVQHFETEACRDRLLCPHNGAESHWNNLKVKILDDVPKGYFLCESWHCTFFENNLLSHYKGDRCQCGRCMNVSCMFTGPSSLAEKDGGIFVKKSARLMITDDLHVMSPLSAATCSLITKLGVMNENSKIEQLTYKVGVNEVMELLMSSLVSKTPLTEILLRHKQQKVSTESLGERKCIGSQMSGDMMNENVEKISVKLTIGKSKNIVCYAEAGEDFVNLLFSFLTLPLGFISRHIQDVPWHGCINHLSKSAHDLDEQYLKSNYHKETLDGSKTCPGISCENYFFGIEDCLVAPYYYAFWWNVERRLRDILTTDKSRIPSNAVTVPLKLKNNKIPQGYLKGATMFTITDKLIIRPLSPILGFSVLNELKVPLTDIKEETVQVGKVEALRLLVASFVCDSALTDVFIRQLKKEQ